MKKKAVKKINIKKINKLTLRYVDTKDDTIWEELIPELYTLIDVQLGKSFTRIKELWADLRQDIIINLWENRKNVGKTCSNSFYNHYYNRIRNALNRAATRYEGAYDFVDMNIKVLDELTSEERKEAQLQPIEKENYED